MTRYYVKGADVIAIGDEWSCNFDPDGNSEAAEQYRVWLSEGNIPEEWSPDAN